MKTDKENAGLKQKILEVEKLKTNFYTYEGVVKALDEINFHLEKGDTLGIVGETGCGKSVTVLSIMKLVMPPGRIEGGRVYYLPKNESDESNKIDLISQPEEVMMGIRGNEISMIFQEASNALNPVLTIGQQVAESFLLHRQEELCLSVVEKLKSEMESAGNFFKLINGIRISRYRRKYKKARNNRLKDRHYGRLIVKEAWNRSVNLLKELGVPNPSSVVKRYPHELSGGMQQRVVISMALACNPNILIADEPTSNLDVTIQAQILDLIEKLKSRYDSSILFITHDLGVVSEVANKVIVLYAGVIVEYADVMEIFKNPLHPYTRALLRSIPKSGSREKLESIRGNVPNLVNPPAGCRFHPRCDFAMPECRTKKPEFYRVASSGENEHYVSCFLFKEKNNKENNDRS